MGMEETIKHFNYMLFRMCTRRITSGGTVVFYNGGGQEYGLSTGRGTVANTAQVVLATVRRQSVGGALSCGTPHSMAECEIWLPCWGVFPLVGRCARCTQGGCGRTPRKHKITSSTALTRRIASS